MKYGTFLLAYLLGSIPTAIWLSKGLYKKDVRNYGSGNAGSTNMYRVFGFTAGFITQIIDILKGYIATNLPVWFWDDLPEENKTYILLAHGLLAVIGHVYPVFAKFKGGKGINTLLGMMIAIEPMASLVGVLVFIIVLLIWKYVSLASMTAVLSFPLYLLFSHFVLGKPLDIVMLIVGFLLWLGVTYTHRSNIKRLLNGTESKASFLVKKK